MKRDKAFSLQTHLARDIVKRLAIKRKNGFEIKINSPCDRAICQGAPGTSPTLFYFSLKGRRRARGNQLPPFQPVFSSPLD